MTPYNITEVLWVLIPQYRDKCSVRCPNPQYRCVVTDPH